MPAEVFREFIDSPTIVANFQAEPGCDAPFATPSDVFAYQNGGSGATFSLQTVDGESARGDPITGELSLVSCTQ